MAPIEEPMATIPALSLISPQATRTAMQAIPAAKPVQAYCAELLRPWVLFLVFMRVVLLVGVFTQPRNYFPL